MFRNLVKYCLFVLLPIYIGGNTTAFSKDYALSLKVDSYPSKCSKNANNQFVIYLTLGDVDRQDSLFGFDAYLKYDTSKVRFLNYSSVNTFFGTGADYDVAGANLGFEPGMISLYGSSFQFTNPKYGNKPLIAVLGEFKTNCFDTTSVVIDDYDFTDEFKGNITNFESAVIFQKKINNDGFISTSFGSDTVDITDQINNQIDIMVNQNYQETIKSLTFHLNYDKNIIKINNISSLNESALKIDSMNKSDNLISLFTTVTDSLDNSPLLRVDYEKITIEKEGKSNISVLPVKSDNCSCTEIMNGSDLFLKWKSNDTVGVVDDLNSKINILQNSNSIIVLTDGENIKTIELFDFSGRLVSQLTNSYATDYFEFEKGSLVSGVYFLRVITDKMAKNKIILLNN